MTITDLEEIACSTFDVRRKELMARAVARRVVKKATVYAAKDAMQEGTGLGSLAMDAAGVLWEAAESADTRCWGLLPREIQVLRIELPAGRHRLSLGPLQGGRKIGGDQAIDIEIIDGRNSYALSYFPDSQPIGLSKPQDKASDQKKRISSFIVVEKLALDRFPEHLRPGIASDQVLTI